ncbi:MAG TPA: molybdopterin-dependent oxidoreductase [Methanocella sp.]|uniref:molybdopterin-dependent oxidoreductase n=1 Tax=Methanocella sp. TaxID=2052833 RepID=UPI002C374243|nr:molybdopterin-dependent oxidoreductase [Methanocella sp.]HTY89842.1 molybdopterin-dependent oxidoreductase [Methanocella sp.]
MDRTKLTAIITMLAILLAMTAISGCTTGTMTVSPTPEATAVPTAAPTTAPVVTPAATAVPTPAATPVPTSTPSTIPYWLGPYPTMSPWTPGNDIYVPTPTADAGYSIYAPWIDQKEQEVGPVILTVTGNVNNPLSLKKIDLKAYSQMTVTATVPKKSGTLTITASGPLLNDILNAASPKSGATKVKFTAADGSYSSTVNLADIRDSPTSIIGLMSDGTLRDILVGNPPFSGSNWVSNLGSIEVI